MSIKFSNKPGSVFWITGLAGSGKTSVGLEYFKFLKKNQSNTVFIDGDILREVLDQQGGISMNERKKLSINYSKLCRMLSEQGINVVCCTISMFDSVREWNRKNINDYHEIYLKVPVEVLHQRDKKGLYSGAMRGEIKNVVGVDIGFEEPKAPNLIINNRGDMSIEDILNCMKKYFTGVN